MPDGTVAGLYSNKAGERPPDLTALSKATSIGPSPEPSGDDLSSWFQRNVVGTLHGSKPEQAAERPADAQPEPAGDAAAIAPEDRFARAIHWVHDKDQRAANWVRENPWDALMAMAAIYSIGGGVVRHLAVKAAETGAERGIGGWLARRATGRLGEQVAKTAATRSTTRAGLNELGDETWRQIGKAGDQPMSKNPWPWLLENKYELKDVVDAIQAIVSGMPKG